MNVSVTGRRIPEAECDGSFQLLDRGTLWLRRSALGCSCSGAATDGMCFQIAIFTGRRAGPSNLLKLASLSSDGARRFSLPATRM